MIQPKAYKLKCLQCRYSKLITPKSDVLNITDLSSTCPKCNAEMQRVDLTLLDVIRAKFKI